MLMVQFSIKTFQELSAIEIYEMLQLRCEVFVVEQDCVYQDIDNKDQKAFHIIGYKNSKLVAYSRVFDAGDYFELPSIGRIVVKKEERQFKYGHELVANSIDFILQNFKNKNILISAQTYLTKFYNSHGFQQQGEEYLEDGIPHIKMLRKDHT
jgi:ElaA protein